MYWKVLIFVWPFLKELLLGEATVKEAVQNNKVRVVAIFIIALSLALNFLALPRLVYLAKEHLDLVKAHNQSEKELQALKDKKCPVVVKEPHIEASAVEPAAPVKPHKAGHAPVPVHHSALTDEQRLQETKERFLRMKREEANQAKQKAD